jgi:hypothetical protein
MHDPNPLMVFPPRTLPHFSIMQFTEDPGGALSPSSQWAAWYDSNSRGPPAPPPFIGVADMDEHLGDNEPAPTQPHQIAVATVAPLSPDTTHASRPRHITSPFGLRLASQSQSTRAEVELGEVRQAMLVAESQGDDDPLGTPTRAIPSTSAALTSPSASDDPRTSQSLGVRFATHSLHRTSSSSPPSPSLSPAGAAGRMPIASTVVQRHSAFSSVHAAGTTTTTTTRASGEVPTPTLPISPVYPLPSTHAGAGPSSSSPGSVGSGAWSDEFHNLPANEPRPEARGTHVRAPDSEGQEDEHDQRHRFQESAGDDVNPNEQNESMMFDDHADPNEQVSGSGLSFCPCSQTAVLVLFFLFFFAFQSTFGFA